VKIKIIINNKKTIIKKKKMKEMTNKMKAMYVAPVVELMNARVERGFEGSTLPTSSIENGTGGPVYELD
jgi:hypothetical protein